MSLAVYQKEVEIPFINARVGEFTVNDIQLAMLLDGKEVEIPPSKDNYTVDISCDNADGAWNSEKWLAEIGNITSGKVKCEVNFHTPKPTLSEITATAEKTSINLSYTASGIGTATTCVYGTEEGNYTNSVEEVQNISCNITGLEMDTTYYYKVCAKNATGEICKEENIHTKPMINLIKEAEIGDYVSMTPLNTSYTIATSVTGYTSDQTINPSELNLWRVIKINDDGTVDMVSEYVSSTVVYFRGKKGFENLIGGLNDIASSYVNEKVIVKSRHIGYYDGQMLTCKLNGTSMGTCKNDGDDYKPDFNLVLNGLGTALGLMPNGENGDYWISARNANGNGMHGRHCDGKYTFANYGPSLYYTDGNIKTYVEKTGGQNIRPILTLKFDVNIISGDGKSAETAYQLG